ncbi:MAG: hypothetical protein C0482_05010 [Gordonia sp.]|nr:hypothetical protein [Gordonia sp. (in: high G+C Gram-positive bacteria)]
MIAVTSQGDVEPGDWSFGQGYNDPRSGDIVYLLRTGQSRGIVASGWITSDGCWWGRHWADSEKDAPYVDVAWDAAVDDDHRLPTEIVQDALLPEFKFPVQSSGRKIPEPSASVLAALWAKHLDDTARETGSRYLGGRARRPEDRVSEQIPLHRNTCRSYDVNSFASFEAVRVEAALVDRFATWLSKDSHKVAGYRLWCRGIERPLFADLFDATDNVLYEAKASASREAVRMALGQLLDYSRHISPSPRLAVLLPESPADDLVNLLSDYGVACVVEISDGRFVKTVNATQNLPVPEGL